MNVANAGAPIFRRIPWPPDGGVEAVPHLLDVIRRLPKGSTPMEIQQFCTSPHRTLRINDVAVSPVEWLNADRDPEAVFSLIAQL